MELSELKSVAIELMDALKQKGLGEVELKLDDARITIKAQPPAAVTVVQGQANAQGAPQATGAAEAAVSAVPETATHEETGTLVKAPLVGTFYGAPSPDAPPFVLAGQKVKKGDTLFIIEAMKTMNEIEAPCDGTIRSIMAQPGDLVEYHQVIVVMDE